MLEQYFYPIKHMRKKYPKAAKRRRIIKKWLNRFGPDVDFEKLINTPSPMFEIMKQDNFSGAYIAVPLKFKKNFRRGK